MTEKESENKTEYKRTLEAVGNGDKNAKTKLAWFMLSGRDGAPVDPDGAVTLLEEQVKDKDAEAMWMLGLCCEYGMGTELDIKRAESLYWRSRRCSNETGTFLHLNRTHPRGKGYLRGGL